jgi:hypothetical protein
MNGVTEFKLVDRADFVELFEVFTFNTMNNFVSHIFKLVRKKESPRKTKLEMSLYSRFVPIYITRLHEGYADVFFSNFFEHEYSVLANARAVCACARPQRRKNTSINVSFHRTQSSILFFHTGQSFGHKLYNI